MPTALLAFIEGLGLIVSPCILPVLPFLLATSLDGGRARPFGIVTGFVLFFSAFAFLSRGLIAQLGVDTELLRNGSIILLGLLGLVMLIPALGDRFSAITEKLSAWGQNVSSRFDNSSTKLGGFFSGIGIGGLIGLVWTPCAGPVMAAALVQIIQAKTNNDALVIVVSFACGAALPMLLITLLGRNVMSKFSYLKTHGRIIRQMLGAIVLLFAVMMYFGLDTKLLATSGGNSTSTVQIEEMAAPKPAPDFVGITQWFNSEPLTLQQLHGKVVLVDFWTYSCINCIRTLPAVKSWYAKYHDKGLVVVGVHAPEFDFEKKSDNVAMAIKKFGILYPVALDNNFATWNAYDNKYWPAHYLIDQKGQIVYTHFGEGHYDVTEGKIRELLGITDKNAEIVPTEKNSAFQSPETYLGSARAENFSSPEGQQNNIATYSFPSSLPVNNWALDGQWKIDAERIESAAPNAGLRFNFTAGKVFLVMGSADKKPIKVTVTMDGKKLESASGADVKNGTVTVQDERLYELIALPKLSSGELELRAERPGLQAYAFTFGE